MFREFVAANKQQFKAIDNALYNNLLESINLFVDHIS